MKKRKKLILVLVAIVFLVIMTVAARTIYNRHYRTYRFEKRMTNTSSLKYYYSGKRRIENWKSGKSSPKFDWIVGPHRSDSLAVFSQDTRRGYINKYTAEVFIPAQYSHAWIFSEGLAAVVQNNHLGFINPDGSTAVPFQFPYFHKRRVHYLFKNGYCIAQDSTQLYGLIDKNGNWVVKPEFDYISNPVLNYRVIRQNGKHGLMDWKLNQILEIVYDKIRIRRDGFEVEKDGIVQLLDFNGQIVVPFMYDELRDLEISTGFRNSDGYEIFAPCSCVAYVTNGQWGLMTRTGKVVTPAKFSEITAISKNVFSCRLGGRWLNINENGKNVSVSRMTN